MLTSELPKTYNPKETEEEIYKLWEQSGFFNPDNLPERHKEPFSIVLPPPNVTDKLHLGSALMLAIQDIMIRFQRMRGKKTLWLPGTDHASIATETKFLKEKKLLHKDFEGKREEFIGLVGEYALENQKTIINQTRKMGSSLDWSRLAYTLDEKRAHAVREAFVRMWNTGIIYRAEKVINWDPKGQTTISDDEIVYETRQATLYTFKYSKDFPISIATTRPETKVGDTAVAVNPNDKRYTNFVGQKYRVEFAKAPLEITIITDESVDPEFGTGALGVTPAHSIIDSEIALRHKLPSKQVINEYAKMTDAAGPMLTGKKAVEAREIIVSWLKENGLLEKEETVEQNIATAERSGGIIEPLPKRHQLFIDVNKPIPARDNKSLKELMREPIATGKIKILPERFEKVYFHWIDNLRDWNISRQIWFGHRIPLWYRNGNETYIGLEAPKEEGWTQETDTLDTWFSSGLWTFSTLGWPEETSDLKTFHPTSVLETGYDILFFWVARMILMSQFHLGEIPFKTVYLHGLVRDDKNRKISKSLGNNIDPLDIIKDYGTDALRMAMVIGTSVGNDSKVSMEKFKAHKHFANKLWNISRFILMNVGVEVDLAKKPKLSEKENAYISELESLIKDVTADLDEFRFYLAGEKLYHYVWHTFADKIIEEEKEAIKSASASAQWTLFKILTDCLKMLHPFMPFITEEIYSKLPIKDKNLLMVENWPSK